jgi:hypothetical protein
MSKSEARAGHRGRGSMMFDYLRFRIRVRRLEKLIRTHRKAAKRRVVWGDDWRKAIKEAEESWKEKEESFRNIIYSIHTDYLRSEAHRLVVPMPDQTDDTVWRRACPEGKPEFEYLTAKGINDLRAAIRAEKKVRREHLLMWLPMVVALTGLIGAATGLAAILRSGQH